MIQGLKLLHQFRKATANLHLPCFFACHNGSLHGGLLIYPREGYSVLAAYDGEYWAIYNNGYEFCKSEELADVMRGI